MGYEIAINKAWDELAKLSSEKTFSIKFLADTYDIDLAKKLVLSLSCNAPAKDFSAILILHYLTQKLKALPEITGEWLTFRELSGIEGYYPAFKKRSIDPIIRKYGNNPQGLFQVLERLPAEKIAGSEVAIVINALDNVPALIKVWGADEEFQADANIYFDKSITKIFCTEDIVVLAGIIAGSL